MDREEYYQTCVEYALSTGWLAEGEEKMLREKYLGPIFEKYKEIIEEVEPFLKEDDEAEISLQRLTDKLDPILDRTKRICCTDPSNIIKSIRDYRYFHCSKNYYEEYSATVLLRRISELLFQ
jgi:hypothetical protein